MVLYRKKTVSLELYLSQIFDKLFQVHKLSHVSSVTAVLMLKQQGLLLITRVQSFIRIA